MEINKLIIAVLVLLSASTASYASDDWDILQALGSSTTHTLITQDFTTFTEYDANSCITINSSTQVTVTDGELDSNGYVYKDYTSIEDFHHRIQASCSELGASSGFGFYSVGEGYGTIADMGAVYAYIDCRFSDFGAGDIMLWEVKTADGTNLYSSSIGISLSTNYYFDFLREGGVFTATMDNDADFSSPLTQFTVTATETYRYIQAVHSREAGSYTNNTDMVVFNLQVADGY